MVYYWDRDKPESINDKTWRREQIKKYLRHNPQSQPKDVLGWIISQTPNPWPSCDTNSLGKIIRRLRKTTTGKDPTLCRMIRYDEVKPIVIKWDMRIYLLTKIFTIRDAISFVWVLSMG